MGPEVIDYESPSSTFALAFSPLGSSSNSKSHANQLPDLKLAVGTAMESYSSNHVTIVGLSGSSSNCYDPYDDPMNSFTNSTHPQLHPLATAPHPYPPTALAFSPIRLSESLQASSSSGQMVRTREMLATSSECIRLWDFAQGVAEDDRTSGFVSESRRLGLSQKGTSYQLVPRSQMANSKADYSAPLTSFSWSQLDPSLIVTSSIDTTCTVWDISSNSAITQLIAHDREVYDVCWSSASREIFASVGADGSVRMFDLRSLDHSTILYEAQGGPFQAGRNGAAPTPISPAGPGAAAPLLRLKFNPVDPNYIAVCSAVGADVQLLDVRAPGVPIVELRAHQATVNGVAWSGDGNVLGTCGDDCQVLIWDLSGVPSLGGGPPPPQPNTRTTAAHTKTLRDPILAYTAPQEVNALTWSEANRDWVAIGLGRRVRCLKV
ncbi:hypothetical protein PGT21_033268 [Puccinia graminis f. sp. tritici]|uniref:Uncharacterized protein n=1 Tax=Puccinia graminis f. sp. tritici TaxID=56615 RepID=A0A5B0PZV2_PUCGR|nr:hypothetical protein PGT21_033268 [Puccinia graminis f. sp. tritici]KAA1109380.1 hypothetical protein PGTUg99_031303 [Puccinia graminis f. sp. tritici]